MPAADAADAAVLKFVKMHGAGNDYVYASGFDQSLPTDDGGLAALARRVADRHFGVGGDGLILVLPPTGEADVRMRMFNLDGSEGMMCGNGIRCVAKFAADAGLLPGNATTAHVETASGVRSIELVREHGEVVGARVDMGEPELGKDAVGLTQGVLGRGTPYFKRDDGHPDHAFKLYAGSGPPDGWAFVPVSMGNPHAVFFRESLAGFDAATVGPNVAEHPAFEAGVNAHFVEVLGWDRVRVIHWERGSGPTLACGTGACAVCVAGVLTNRTNRAIAAEVPGGELELTWDEATNRVSMTGPATEVFRGEIRL